uniref:Uncharacterized protein n=1 Tax=Brassica oleracea var. oleracea TaxID=109376 RepID=A0A0D3BDV5_BRAOL
MIQRGQEGELDEGFLSEVSAHLRQRSYAKKSTLLKSLAHSKLPLFTNKISSRLHLITGNEVLKAEHFVETLIKAPEEQWNMFFLEGLTLGKGEVTPDEFSAVIT